ncbi:hypothetical protein CC2G_004030 [Coprinopsis cinerea AmutBmut pab1-1]|nr:hypothetical protein CC2G_004030 [Coprinopsis cinerea AmutBmut pab1-1]
MTVLGWYHCFAVNILRNAVDPTTNTRNGIRTLTTGGFNHSLKATVLYVTLELNLERHRVTHKPYWGTNKVLLILRSSILLSGGNGKMRETTIQGMIRALFTYYGTLRPSSLSYTEKTLEKYGMFIKVGDVDLLKSDFGTFSLARIKNYKGTIKTIAGVMREYCIDAVLNQDNILLDLPMMVALQFFMRDLFETPFKSIYELCSAKDYHFKTVASRKDEPLFLACLPGGKGFQSPPQAASSPWVSSHAVKAGLSRASCGAIRRDGANKYHKAVGAGKTQSILSHNNKNEEVLDQFYITTTRNLNLVAIRNNDIDRNGNPILPHQQEDVLLIGEHINLLRPAQDSGGG